MKPITPVLRFLVLVALYVAGDWLGEHLIHGPDQVTLVWVPAGVSLAALVLYGRNYWPFIVVAEIIVQLWPEPGSLVFIGFTVLANTLSALAAASVVQHFRDRDIERFVTRSGYVLIAAALLLALISAVFGVSGLLLSGYAPVDAAGSAFIKWMVANFFGVLLVCPAVLLIAQLGQLEHSGDGDDWAKPSEIALWLSCMLAALTILLKADRNTSDYVLGLSALPLGLLVWSALRFRPWLTAVASLVVGLTMAVLAGLGLAGYRSPETMTDAVILLGFLSVIAVVPLFLTGATNQNRLAARRLLKRASTDELTGLPNRSGFEGITRRWLRQSPAARLGLLYVDLDNFKLVNDSAGHAAGDQLVCALSGVLRAKLHDDDVLARLGGDEFAVLLRERETADTDRQAKLLRDAVRDFRFPVGGHVFSLTASIGAVPFTVGEADYSQLLAQADAACFTAKELGGNRVQLGSGGEPAVDERTTAMRWAVRIEDGIANDRFQVYCQSIVPLQPERAHGRHFEVLIRLYDAEQDKLLMPAQFVPAAERFRMGTRLDRHVLDRTLRWLEQRPDWAAEVEQCSINLCAASLEDVDFAGYLHQRLASSSVPAHKLCFEITETSAIRDLAEAQRFIDGVRALGCKLALDDFGTGFCSFAYLDSLDVDYFKIDGSFVRKIESSALSLSIVRAIADIARSINKFTVAEFVESESLRRRLAELGVDFAQGYAIDRPQPIEVYFTQPAAP